MFCWPLSRISKGLPPSEDIMIETIVCEEFDDVSGRSNDPNATLH
jgi:hypothetical protein